MYDFGYILQEKRKAKGFTQLMLAQKIGMSPVQLCKIEKGKTSPTVDTVERISGALDISISDLLSRSEKQEAERAKAAGDKTSSRFYPVRYGNDDKVGDGAVLEAILPVENTLCCLEDSLKIAHATLLPFVHSFKIEPFGARTVARYMRAACAVGSSSFSDLVELLEFRNVRLHIMKLPEGVQSR